VGLKQFGLPDQSLAFMIDRVVPGTCAARARPAILIGAQLVAVDGNAVAGLRLEQVAKLMRGDVVVLTLGNNGS
jgi:C-terminal processing protease CtpA/Prc